jgi:single-strand DNA-binding protein
MNVWSFTGNIGQDCERKALPSGKTVCEFSVGVSSGYGDKKKTTWAKCALFGKAAEGKLPEYLVKGAKVAVTGEVTLEEWAGKDGATRHSLRVAVNTVDLIGSKPASNPQPVADDFESDSIPF